jgi:hypothetical protein
MMGKGDETMATTTLRCTYCNAPIVDESTKAVVGDQTYCCLNCAMGSRLEAAGPAAAERSPQQAEHCACCGVPILDVSTRVTGGGSVYCCENCLAMMQPKAQSRAV